MKRLTIVYDTYSECHAVYIDGICRGNWDEGNFDILDLIECYETFARDEPVIIERLEVSSCELRIWDDDAGVDWPEQLGELLANA